MSTCPFWGFPDICVLLDCDGKLVSLVSVDLGLLLDTGLQETTVFDFFTEGSWGLVWCNEPAALGFGVVGFRAIGGLFLKATAEQRKQNKTYLV